MIRIDFKMYFDFRVVKMLKEVCFRIDEILDEVSCFFLKSYNFIGEKMYIYIYVNNWR